MKIAILDPYFAGSHRVWAEGWQSHSQHDIHIYSLEARYWKWRMHGGAITLYERLKASGISYDYILASDMMDVALLRGLIGREIAQGVYFHESQLSYPWSAMDSDRIMKRDRHYEFINFSSALAADQVFFNSEYHKNVFLEQLPDFLKIYPDHSLLHSVNQIVCKSKVLPIGIDFSSYKKSYHKCKNPCFIWNHRWEYDKNPNAFYRFLKEVASHNVDFELVVLGQSFGKYPTVFDRIREDFSSQIKQWGYAESKEEYLSWIHYANILPVTSEHEFFGISTVEAIAAGVFPLLPDRLAYPEHIPMEKYPVCIYKNEDDMVQKALMIIEDKSYFNTDIFQKYIQKYSWKKLIEDYDSSFRSL